MRNIIVTGGSRGLGLAIARSLASGGDRVIVVARRQTEALAAAEREAAGAGNAICFRPFDLADIARIGGFVAGLRDEFRTLQGLVNNAALGTPGVLATMQDTRIEQLVKLNVLSPITLTKYVVRSMMVGGGGRIVNVSSVVSFTGYSGLSVYSATKSSLAGFTRSLARELGPLGITVNSVAPGFLETEMTGGMADAHLAKIAKRSALGRLPEVGDVADAVAYLLSDKARHITGTTLTIDAGNTA
ncbi:MAG TPA: SDR family NAD(P)-dependent oxidoreductase [Acetobacteraceae bacterium]|nr:SDR family NAD(P)-dependent oxidoreductase [Acetobacteraceae bacterium]